MTTLDKLPGEVTLPLDTTAETVDQLRSGAPFVGLLIDDPADRARALEAVLDQMSDGDTRIIWIGNPLRAALTIERFFLQAVGPEADLRFERSPADLANMLARRIDNAKRLLLIVQQPETMDPETRDTLAVLPNYWQDEDFTVQFLFSGIASFQPPDIKPRPLLPPTLSSSDLKQSSFALALSREAALPDSANREILPIILLVLLVALCVFLAQPPQGQVATPYQLASRATTAEDAASSAPRASPRTIGSVAVRAALPTTSAFEPIAIPDPPVVAPPPEAPAPPPSGSRTRPPPVEDILALRREFDAFLAQRAPTVAALNDVQKDSLFQEFLFRHRQRAP